MTVPDDTATLMLHESFLRRVALGVLGGDEQLADDVLQETWIRAAGRTPDQPDRERSWLAVVTMNTARSLRRRQRSHERMRDRIAASSRGPAIASGTSDELERRALLADVTDALLALPEPYREAVRLRYVDGLGPTAISERIGVPVETVRTRVKRGLERMRIQLDERYGSRETWRHVLLPWIPASLLSRVGATGASVAIGAGLAKSVSAAVGVLVLVAILVLALFRGFGGPPTSDPHAVANIDANPVNVSDVAAASDLPVFAGEVSENDANVGARALRTARLRGRVLDESGRGVTGVDVAVFCSDAPLRRVVTDEDGGFALTFDDATTVTVIHVDEGPRTLGTTDASTRFFELGADEWVEIRVPSGGSISGRVVTEGGEPVTNAEVLAWKGTSKHRGERPPMRQTVTDDEGRFVLHHLGAFRLAARAPELVTLEGLLGDLSSGGHAKDVRVTMTRSVTRHGRVVDPDGEPVAGVVLTALETNTVRDFEATSAEGIRTSDATFARAVSGPDGRFELGPVSARTLRVEYECRGYESGGAYFGALEPSGLAWGNPVSMDEHGDVQVVIQPASHVTGRIVDARGNPIEGAYVRGKDFHGERAEAVTTEHGFFRLVGLRPDERYSVGVVLVSAAGHAIHVREHLDFEPGTDLGDIMLEPERVLEGIVVDAAEEPIAGVRVKIEGNRYVESERSYGKIQTWEWMLQRSETRTDPLGAFAIEGLYDGEFEVVVEAGGRRAVRRVRSGEGAFVLRIDETTPLAPSIRGTVTDAWTGERIESFEATWMRRYETSARSTGNSVTDGGTYSIDAFELGLGYLSVKADGYALWQSPERVVDAGQHLIDVVLVPARRIEVHVIDSRGEGRPAWIEVRHDGKVIPNRQTSGAAVTPTYFDQGTGFLDGVPADLVTLRVAGVVGEKSRDFEIDLRTEQDGPIVLEID